MNKIYNPTPESWSAILERPTKTIDDIELTVKEIFKEVQKKGDEAIANIHRYLM
jgi:histidinol dehydrogenase